MTDRSLVRALMSTAALAAVGTFLAGCNVDDASLAANVKANQPVPPKLVEKMAEKDMDPQSPILVRLFKQEAVLEVWKQDRSGNFALLKSYPICRWSGDLGPKVHEGDRQAPEGFYSITPAQMNPQSAYYLSFNTGYPNAYDRALGHTGAQLMVHGDCSSRGCYAMTDEQIAEIYALGRESFFGGQKAFQFQAYPFRFTPVNLAKHRNNPNMAFWKMIKEGYDHFEVTRREPKVDFCEKHYVFDAQKPPNATRDPVFEASAKCPAYIVSDEIASPVRDKQRRDEAEYAKLVAKGTPVAKLNSGIDGGMNEVFAAHLPNGNTGLSDGGEGQALSLASSSRTPGTIPSTVNPPHAPNADDAAAAVSAPAPATRIASAAPGAQSEGFFTGLARKIGLSNAAADTSASAPVAQSTPVKPKVAETRRSEPPKAVAAKPAETKQAETKQAETKQAEAKHGASHAPIKPSLAEAGSQPSDPSPPPAKDVLLAGAQPIVSASSFESRFSAIK
ncbi:MAG: hypothetical protein JO283_13540 [Bradyrhizobium sp.]|nr:hypothetical protein [Bradyrhizobium sp.]